MTDKKTMDPKRSKGKTRKARRKSPTQPATARGREVPPYGPPINEAIARGELNDMKRVASWARRWIVDVDSHLRKLEEAIKDIEDARR
jgi:hypothetical protein